SLRPAPGSVMTAGGPPRPSGARRSSGHRPTLVPQPARRLDVAPPAELVRYSTERAAANRRGDICDLLADPRQVVVLAQGLLALVGWLLPGQAELHQPRATRIGAGRRGGKATAPHGQLVGP